MGFSVQNNRLLAALVRFLNDRCHFRDTKKIFLTISNFFSAKLKKIGNYVNNHPLSNPEPLLPNTPLITLHYRVDPPISRKI